MRTRSTVEGLQRAAELGLADAGDCALLVDAYRRLRKLEHRMRMVHDRSEHILPRDPVELDKLARRAGHASGAALRADCEHWTREVRLAYERVLAGPESRPPQVAGSIR
jgi:glutamate-ammonia-ligase adenylyltransferase